ncbi:MAG: hypothetical protein GY748_05895 [Planctomycetaceae bacterium]|nr:hypothetical protein [Planctomycetaceae bacterium]
MTTYDSGILIYFSVSIKLNPFSFYQTASFQLWAGFKLNRLSEDIGSAIDLNFTSQGDCFLIDP